MPTDIQQAVVETPDAQAKPATEGANAQDKGDELDALLSQFDAESKTEKTEPDSKPGQKSGTDPDPVKNLADEVAELRRRETDRQYKQDIRPVIEKLRGDIPTELYDDEDVQDWLDRQAKQDPRITRAWLNRHKDPVTFNKVVDGLGKKLSQRFAKLPDKSATEDREAVTAAVRGASHKAPEGKAPDYSKSGNHDFKKDVEERFGYTPRV
jgi:hypothetical protein